MSSLRDSGHAGDLAPLSLGDASLARRWRRRIRTLGVQVPAHCYPHWKTIHAWSKAVGTAIEQRVAK